MSLTITIEHFRNYGEALHSFVQDVEPYTRLPNYTDLNSKRLRLCVDEAEKVSKNIHTLSPQEVSRIFQQMVDRLEESLISPVGPHRLRQDPVIDGGIGWEREDHTQHRLTCKTFRDCPLQLRPPAHLFAKAVRLWLDRCQNLQKGGALVVRKDVTSGYELAKKDWQSHPETEVMMRNVMESAAVAVLGAEEWADQMIERFQTETDEIKRRNAEEEAMLIEEVAQRSQEIEARIGCLDQELVQVQERAKAQETFLLNKAKILEEKIAADEAANKNIDEARKKELAALKQEVEKVRIETAAAIQSKTKQMEEQSKALLAHVEQTRQSQHASMMALSHSLETTQRMGRDREVAIITVRGELAVSRQTAAALQHQTAQLQARIHQQEREIADLRDEIDDNSFCSIM